ncbi:DUF6316 family protein [Aurantivibrio plasticivorans]
MKFNRTGEQGRVPERSDRFYCREEYWYYTTREGVDIGPFDSLDDAANGVNEFIEYVCEAEPSFSATLQQYSSHAA